MIHQTAGESVFKIHKSYINFHAKHQDQAVQTSKDQSKLGRNKIDIWNHRSSDEGIKKKWNCPSNIKKANNKKYLCEDKNNFNKSFTEFIILSIQSLIATHII